KAKINYILLFLVFFLSFIGFYAIILVAVNAGMSGYTRILSIPIRLLIGAALIGLIIINFNKIKVLTELKIFALFALIYICRVVLDYALGEKYSLSTPEVLFYFISFSVIPF